MMDWTDRHCRYFHRLLSRNTLLYTEMVTTGALRHGDVQRHLRSTPKSTQSLCNLAAAMRLIWRMVPSWASSGATTKSTSTAVVRLTVCSVAHLARV